MEQKLFQITEFAKIARTSRKTLQYYDELDLFRPALVGENGYRYYTLSQLDRLALIAALRDMGLSLREIKSYLQQEDGENLNALLEAQLDRAEEMMERLRRRKALLTEMLAENRLLQSLCGQGYQMRRWEAQRAVKLTDLDRSIIVNYLTDGLHTGLCIPERGVSFLYQKREDGDIPLPGGTCLCLCDLVEETSQERNLAQTTRLREYAAGAGISLEGDCFVEFNDLLAPRREGRQLLVRLMRVGVAEG